VLLLLAAAAMVPRVKMAVVVAAVHLLMQIILL
jgi:hypothetical protein